MTKADLIASVQAKAGLSSKAKADEILKAFIETITETLDKGDAVSLSGFGTFKIVERAARTGRNPSTGMEIKIPATKVAKFSDSKILKNTLK